MLPATLRTICFCGLLLGLPLAASAAAHDTEAAALSVRIVPTSSKAGGAGEIALYDAAQRFHVVLTNRGSKPIRLWREWCSWGYFNLSFTALAQDGSPIPIRKKPLSWGKNYPDWTHVGPGDHVVIEVSFDALHWEDAPLPPRGEQRTVSLQAVYESVEDKESKAAGVWSGRAVSPRGTYVVRR